MEIVGVLVSAVRLPGSILGPLVPGPPGRRLVTTRSDTELAVYDVHRLAVGDTVAAVTFPAPWPRDAGGVDAVSPGLDIAVFVGPHAVRAVEPDGRTRWEVRHACWACGASHESVEEFDGDADHRFPDHGSAGFDVAGRVWAHARVLLADEDAVDDPRGELRFPVKMVVASPLGSDSEVP